MPAQHTGGPEFESPEAPKMGCVHTGLASQWDDQEFKVFLTSERLARLGYMRL